jgi:hypothetical protein
MVVDAVERRPPEKVRSVEVELLRNGYPMVLVMTPVPELYAIPLPAESDDDEILFWKVLQSVEVSAPVTTLVAFGRLKVIC